jgi:hypothetical protein
LIFKVLDVKADGTLVFENIGGPADGVRVEMTESSKLCDLSFCDTFEEALKEAKADRTIV